MTPITTLSALALGLSLVWCALAIGTQPVQYQNTPVVHPVTGNYYP